MLRTHICAKDKAPPPAVIFKVHNGIISRLAGNGSSSLSCGNSGSPLDACLRQPPQVAVHPLTLDILITSQRSLFAISGITGNISRLVVGNGTAVMTSKGGVVNYNGLLLANAVAVDGATGDIYFGSLNAIWRVSADGSAIVPFAGTSFAGSSCSGGTLDVPATELCFVNVNYVTVGDSGSLLVTDGSNAQIIADGSVSGSSQQLLAVTTTGAVRVAGQGGGDVSCMDGGSVTSACVVHPTGVAVRPNGDTIFVDTGDPDTTIPGRVRVVAANTGVITTAAGRATCTANATSGTVPAVSRCFAPLDLTGALAAHPVTGDFVLASMGEVVYVNASSGASSVVALVEQPGAHILGALPSAAFVCGMAFDPVTLDLLVGDSTNCAIYRIELGSGTISTIAGRGQFGCSRADSDSSLETSEPTDADFVCSDRDGACLHLASPCGMSVAGDSLLISDSYNNVLRALDLRSNVSDFTAFAGDLSCDGGDYADGVAATLACLHLPTGVAVSVLGDVVFVDDYSRALRVVSTFGVVSTLYSCPSCAFQAISFDRSNNIVATMDDYVSLHALLVLVTSARVTCPVGYVCPHGRPVPCTDPHTFCPGNTRAPLVASPRFSPGFPVVTASGVTAFAGAEVCSVGSYCTGTEKLDCPAGTLGRFVGSYDFSSCEPCGPALYSPLSGPAATGCAPCPVGAALPPGVTGATQCAWCASPTHGGGGASQCLACPPGTYSVGGPATCTRLPAGFVFLEWDTFGALVVRDDGAVHSSSGLQDASLASATTVVSVAVVVLMCIPALLILLRVPSSYFKLIRVLDAFRHGSV